MREIRGADGARGELHGGTDVDEQAGALLQVSAAREYSRAPALWVRGKLDGTTRLVNSPKSAPPDSFYRSYLFGCGVMRR